DGFCSGDVSKTAFWMRTNDSASSPRELRRRVVKCNSLKRIIIIEIQRTKASLANLRRAPKDRFEDRFKIARRGADNLEHIGGSRLPLQRFAQLAEQARVLDSDDGLVSKRRGELNLLICERTDGRLHQHKHADWIALAQHGDAEHSAVAT